MVKTVLMNEKGFLFRWIDGVLEDKENMDQPDNLRAMVFGVMLLTLKQDFLT